MEITIKQAKGKKDRVVPLTEKVLQTLRAYYQEYKPKEYLFNGQFSNQYSATSCNQIIKKFLGKENHMHVLRHTVATNLLEKGTDIKYIKELLGHSNIKTTEIYLHVTTKNLQNLQFAI